MTGLSFHSGHHYDQIVVIKGVVVEGGVQLHLRSHERTQEPKCARSVGESNFYASFLFSKLPTCTIISIHSIAHNKT